MNVLRTPDERFDNLPGFPFPPSYVKFNDIRIHYVSQGDSNSSETVLCLHGEPSWSYLYRKMIPPLTHSGRVVAMDFIGFGRSDKFSDAGAYSYHLHHDTLVHFIDKLDLNQITLVVQDWGGLIGLPVATEMPERFARLVIMNTGLPTGEGPMPEAFLRWRKFAERLSSRLPVGRIIRGGLANPKAVSDEEIAAYEAPFPDRTYKAGAGIWPLLVPINPDDPGAAEISEARRVLSQWQKPTLVMFSDSDPITKGGDRFFRQLIPAAGQQPPIVIEDAGHFLQDERGELIAHHITEFMKRTPVP